MPMKLYKSVVQVHLYYAMLELGLQMQTTGPITKATNQNNHRQWV